MPRACVELELYGTDNEVIKKLSRVVVPWGILKKTLRVQKAIAGKEMEAITPEDMDEMAGLVVEIFGEDQVTRDDIDKYADLGDVIAVIAAVGNRARGLVPNAPPAAK